MTAPTNLDSCYRHPGRAAGIRCQRCDRPICPSCMNQASVGFHCPECASRGAQREYRGLAALRERPIVMQALIALNVLVYVVDAVTRTTRPWTLIGRFLQVQGYGGGIHAEGLLAGVYVPEQPWRLVTAGFLHDGLLHLGMNMWALYVLGMVLEPALGRLRFGAVYGASLLTASLGVVVLDPRSATVGASGAVYGLLGALVLIARDRQIDLVRSGLLPILGLNLLITFVVPGISIGGHVGGLAGGLVFGVLVTRGRAWWGRRAEVVETAVVAGVGVAAAVAAFVLMQVRYG